MKKQFRLPSIKILTNLAYYLKISYNYILFLLNKVKIKKKKNIKFFLKMKSK
jgi:hypothetical protein